MGPSILAAAERKKVPLLPLERARRHAYLLWPISDEASTGVLRTADVDMFEPVPFGTNESKKMKIPGDNVIRLCCRGCRWLPNERPPRHRWIIAASVQQRYSTSQPLYQLRQSSDCICKLSSLGTRSPTLACVAISAFFLLRLPVVQHEVLLCLPLGRVGIGIRVCPVPNQNAIYDILPFERCREAVARER